MAIVSTPIVGASLSTPSSEPSTMHAPGTVVNATDNSDAIYAVATEAVSGGTCTVTRTSATQYDMTNADGGFTVGSTVAVGEGAWAVKAAAVALA